MNKPVKTYAGGVSHYVTDMNKPVAWMSIKTDEEGEFRVYNDTEPVWDETFIPLYTHPAELTDEEILQQAEWIFGTYFFESIDDPYWIEFAKAILRKAQEK